MRYIVSTIVALLVVVRVSAEDKITYQDHIKPIFAASCVSCHNADNSKAGLNLTSYQSIMTGSSAGKVLEPGDPDSSTVYLVTAHEIEPHMPFKGNKLPDAQIILLKKWIEGGAIENASATAAVATKPKLEMKLSAAPTAKPDGPPPMPKDLSLEPIVRGERLGAPGALAASPWAPLVAVSQPHEVLLFDTETRELLGILPFADGLPKVLTFSRNGAVLLAAGGVGGKSGHASLYDVVTGKRLIDVGEEFDEVLAADLSPDQSMVALGGPGRVLKIFSTSDGKLLNKLTQHTDWITSIAYSPDGVLLASGDRNGGLRVWEAGTAREFYTLNGHKGAITSICFRADSNVLASASEDGTVKLWNTNDGALIKSWAAHAPGVLSVDFARNGQLVTSGRDRAVYLWGNDGAKLRDLPVMNDIALRAIFAQEDSRVIAASWNGEVTSSNVADGKPIGAIETNPPTIAERVIEAQRKLKEAESTHAAALVNVTTAQATVGKFTTELQQLQAAATAAQTTLAAAQAKVTANTSAIDAAANGLENLKQDLAVKAAQASHLPTAVLRSAANVSIASVQGSIDGKSALQAKLTAERVEINAQVQTAQAALTAANTAIQPHVDQLKSATEAAAAAKQSTDTSAKQLADAKADLNKWKVADVRSELNRAQEALQIISDHQSQLSAAVDQLESASKLIQEGPKQLEAAKQRLAVATQTHGTATSSGDAINANLASRDAVLKQAGDLLNSLNALASKEPGTSPLLSAAQKARESFDLLSSETEALKKSAVVASDALNKAKDELAAATADLQALESSLAAAPAKLDQARQTIKECLSTDIKSAQLRVDQLNAELQQLSPAHVDAKTTK